MYAVNEKPASSTRPKSRDAPEVKKTLDSLVHGNDRREKQIPRFARNGNNNLEERASPTMKVIQRPSPLGGGRCCGLSFF